jgi:hypothetical protein
VTLAWSWLPRAEPLTASVVVGWGEAALRLSAALLARPDDALGKLQGVAGRDLVAVTGDAGDLPWADGVVYAGRDPQAHALRIPTHQRTDAPLALVERAILAAHPSVSPPILVLAQPTRLVSLAAARPIDRRSLERWRSQIP